MPATERPAAIISASAVAALVALPTGMVIWQAFSLDVDSWQTLWTQRLPSLLLNSFWLGVGSVLLSLLIGLPAAIAVRRLSPLPRACLDLLLVLPLAIPSYVYAHIYTDLFSSNSWLSENWPAAIGLPSFENLFGAIFVLSLAAYPYVYLLSRAALAQLNPHWQQLSQLAGLPWWRIWQKALIPLLRPALATASLIIMLHSLAEFGAVSLLRVQTFTYAIYTEMAGGFDTRSAAALSLVLLAISAVLIFAEGHSRRRQQFYGAATRVKRFKTNVPVWQRLAGWLIVLPTLLLAVALPLGWMLYWSYEAWLGGFVNAEFWVYTRNSLQLGLYVAAVAVLFALPVAWLLRRGWQGWRSVIAVAANSGFVLPGPIAALALITTVLLVAKPLYGSLLVLVLALALRFLPLAIQAQQAQLTQLSPSLFDIGRTVGLGAGRNFVQVILPLMRSGFAAAFVLVFIDALKELPASLLLRPTGYDTLPIRIWMEASEEWLQVAAPAALLLVLLSLPVVWLTNRHYGREPS